MKVLISTDAEGITGIFKKSQVTPGRPDYGQLRDLMVHDMNTTIRGTLAGGVTEVVVNDGHSYDDSILLADLDPRTSLMSGTDKSFIMVKGPAEQVDALVLVGHHSRKGAKGTISHIYCYPIIVDIAASGTPPGEAEFVSHAVGYYGVPTVLLTGDGCVTAFTEKQIPGIYIAVVKKAIDNGSVQLYHPEKTEKLIEEAAKAAVSEYRTVAPIKLKGPMILTITLTAATQAVHACKVPGFTLSKEQNSVVSYTCDDYLELYKAFLDALW